MEMMKQIFRVKTQLNEQEFKCRPLHSVDLCTVHIYVILFYLKRDLRNHDGESLLQ